HAATTPDRRRKRTGARAAGTLLPPRLLAGAVHFADLLDLRRSETLVRAVRDHRVVDGLRANAVLDDQLVGDFDFALLGAGGVDDKNLHTAFVFLMACRTTTYVP